MGCFWNYLHNHSFYWLLLAGGWLAFVCVSQCDQIAQYIKRHPPPTFLFSWPCGEPTPVATNHRPTTFHLDEVAHRSLLHQHHHHHQHRHTINIDTWGSLRRIHFQSSLSTFATQSPSRCSVHTGTFLSDFTPLSSFSLYFTSRASCFVTLVRFEPCKRLAPPDTLMCVVDIRPPNAWAAL